MDILALACQGLGFDGLSLVIEIAIKSEKGHFDFDYDRLAIKIHLFQAL